MVFLKSNIQAEPTTTEIQIFKKVKTLFDQISQEQAEMYYFFEVSRDPAERETLAKRIQSLEEAIIHEVANEHGLSFEQVAKVYCKVERHFE